MACLINSVIPVMPGYGATAPAALLPAPSSAPASAAAVAAAVAGLKVQAEAVKEKEKEKEKEGEQPAALGGRRVTLLQQCERLLDRYKPRRSGDVALAQAYGSRPPFTFDMLSASMAEIAKENPEGPIATGGVAIKPAISTCRFYARVASGKLRVVARPAVEECRLGAGTAAVVFKVWHLNLKRIYALKNAKDMAGLADRVRQENTILKAINGRNNRPGLSPAPIDFFDIPKFIVGMVVRIQQRDLNALLTDENVLMDDTRRLALCAGVVRGLESLEKLSMWHGDIKPYNIMIDFEGNPVISDFEGAISFLTITQDHFPAPTVITPTYIHPHDELMLEAARKRKDLEAYKSLAKGMDRYAVAVVLYKILMHNEHPYRLVENRRHDSGGPLKNEARLVRIYGARGEALAKMLRHNPKERFQSIEQIVKIFCN